MRDRQQPLTKLGKHPLLPAHLRSVLIVIVIVIVAILVPIALRFPALISSVPPLTILTPAPVAFGVQIPPPFFGLMAVLAMLLDCVIQPCLCLLNRMPASIPVIISVRPGCRCKE